MLLSLWIVSITCTITRYGRNITFTMQEGFIGLYCGGDAITRNSDLLNNFTPPWRGSGAGILWSDGSTWAIHGPRRTVNLQRLGHLWKHNVAHSRVLGLWIPSAGLHHRDYAYLVVPLWLPPALCIAGVAFGAWRRRTMRRSNHCRCGYCLEGISSSRCPECGRKITHASTDQMSSDEFNQPAPFE